MSNVIASMALKPSCVAGLTRVPVLRLFSGFQRASTPLRKISSNCVNLLSESNCTRPCRSPSQWTRSLSSSNSLSARQRKLSRDTSSNTPTSKLRPLKNQASHTEGLQGSDVWRNYDPAGGLPLPGGDLLPREIDDIFSGDISDVETGNYILSVMHWRRMSGALIDSGLVFPNESGVTNQQALKGLEYLREKYPSVDEEALGAQWAKEESLRIEQQLQQRALDLRLYRAELPAEEEAEEEDDVKQGTAYGRARSGQSALQAYHREVEIKAKEAETRAEIVQVSKERALLDAARGPLQLAGGVQPSYALKTLMTGEVVLRRPDSDAWLMPVERKPWVKYYEQQAQITRDNTVPQIGSIRRLGPTLLVTLLTIGLCIYFSENYTPPPTEARMFPDIPPSVATTGGITALMLTTFVLSRFPPLWRTNSKYFCVVPGYPYAISLIGAIFRHDTFAHLLPNMITLWLVGTTLHEDVGRGTFLAIFLGTGVAGGYVSLLHNVITQRWGAYVFGSSGAVLGVLGALCALRPNGTVDVFGYEVPIAAWMVLLVTGGGELYAIFRMKNSNIDHFGHIGGILAGATSALWYRAKMRAEHAKTTAIHSGDAVMTRAA